MFGFSKRRRRRQAEKYYEIALAYYEGTDKIKDLKQAVINFREAAERGHPEACKALGWIHLHEDGYPRSAQEAVRWFEKGAALGDVSCAYNLAVIYSNETDVKDYEKAYAYFSQAADAGDADAAFFRAQFLASGIGTGQDTAEAEHWYQKAHEAGHPDAAEELAVLWENQIYDLDAESETDCLQAAKLLRQAAQWHEIAAEKSPSETQSAERKERAQECLQAAVAYRECADEIARQIREAWTHVPEPGEAYCIVLAGDYEHGGRQMLEALMNFAQASFLCTAGSRRSYRFFWFEDQGQYVEVFCCYDMAEGSDLIEEGVLPVSRLIPIVSCDFGLTEDLRLCIESVLAAGCDSILPVLAALTPQDGADEGTARLREQDLMSFAKENGAGRSLPVVRADLSGASEDDSWCGEVLNPEVSWWSINE